MVMKIEKVSYSSSLGVQVAHVNYAVKYRHKIFGKGEVMARALESFKETERAWSEKTGLKILEMGIDKDHVHMVFQWGPGTPLSKIIQLLKGRCAREVLRDFPELRREKFWGGHMWSPAYHFLSMGTADVKHALEYVKDQGAPRVPMEVAGQTKLDRFAC